MSDAAPISLELVERVVGGDVAAWRALQTQVAPIVERWARSHAQMKKRDLARGDSDHVRNVLVASLERLARKDYQNLRSFLESAKGRPHSSFESWLYILVDYAVLDYVRHVYGPSPIKEGADGSAAPETGEAGASRRDVNSFAARIDDDVQLQRLTQITLKLTAQEVMQRVQQVFTPQEFECLRLYITEGSDFGDIARRLGLATPKLAEDLVRALKERLRTMFRDDREPRS